MNYLYNGVELPHIDSFYTDELKEQYPYLTMQYYGLDFLLGEVMLYLTTKPMAYYPDERYKLHANDMSTFDALLYIGNPKLVDGSHENSWKYWRTDTGITDIGSSAHWSNYGILNADGSVYLAASDPIPVSSFTPDPISMTMGWLVGRRIAGQRSKVSPTNEVTP